MKTANSKWQSLVARQIFVCLIFVSQFFISSFANDPPITAVAFSPDGRSVVTCSQAGLQVFDWPTLDQQKKIRLNAENLHCLAFSPNGKQLAVGGGNPADIGIVEILSWPEGSSRMTLAGHDDSVTSVAWQDDTHLVAASLDRTVTAWDLATQKTTSTYQGHSRGVSAVCILSDQTIVTTGQDHSIRVWNAQSGELARSLNQHTEPINAMAIRPASEGLPVVATAAGDRTIRFWQPTIGRMIRYVRLDSEPLDIAWINQSLVVASCVDGKARIVDADNVKVTETIPAIDGWAYAIAVHPSDGSLVIGGSDGQIRRVSIPK